MQAFHLESIAMTFTGHSSLVDIWLLFLQAVLTNCVLVETLDAALEVSSLSNDDLRPKDYKPAYPDINVSIYTQYAILHLHVTGIMTAP